jgi:acetylornithine deacetylase/succinyl-diaminopimelate desuccinylase-like protein
VHQPSEHELREEATALLRELLRIDTSNPPGGETPAAALLARYLERHGVECELIARDPGRANLVARIRGHGTGPSLALLGHTDVVPAEDPGSWTHPPFAGHLDDAGYVWGRGAADMKNELATRVVAMAALARAGARPNGDLVLIAEADEEDGREAVGMRWLVEARPDIATDYALNEGSAERLELRDGRIVIPFTVGEKGACAAVVTALGEAGPTSLPHAGENAVPLLARLIDRLAAYEPRRRTTPETAAALDVLAPGPGTLDERLARAVDLHPMLRDLLVPLYATTIAPTRLHGSSALNVMPGRASVECDCRPVAGTPVEELRAELAAALGDDIPHEIDYPEPLTGGSVSSFETPLADACRDWFARYDPGAALVPMICNGFTDSHYLREAFGTVAYGIWPIRHTPSEVLAEGVHGRDERIHVDDLGYATAFHLDVCGAIGRLERAPKGV